jgi:rhamnosyltransferase
MSPSPLPPRVTVLLATFNGSRWLPEQLESILGQQDIDVRIVASDDASSDDTPALLSRFAADGRLHALPAAPARFGNANRNFMRLIADAPVDDADWIAFADQDDVWLPGKLRRAVDRLEGGALDAYSSDVVAFWPDGRERTLVKSRPPRAHDHLFESAGPGCTFVLPRARFLELREWVRTHRATADSLKVHDWAIYALARSRGWRWEIDPQPGLRYRQHGGNEVGANVGWRAARARLGQALSGQYVADALAIASLVGIDTPLVRRMRRLGWRDRLALAASAPECRRRPAEAWLLAFLFLVMRRPQAAR